MTRDAALSALSEQLDEPDLGHQGQRGLLQLSPRSLSRMSRQHHNYCENVSLDKAIGA